MPFVWAQVFFYVFVAGGIASVVLLYLGYETPAGWRWTEMVLPALAALAALSQLARRLPGQNVVCITVIILLFSFAFVLCAVKSGVPFGPMVFTDKAVPKLWDLIPVWLPLWWVAVLTTCRETARLILQPYRRDQTYGFRLVGLAAVLAVILDLGWEPFGVRVKELWTWRMAGNAPAWYSAPLVNFLGWVIVVAITLGFCAPWFVSKRAVRQPIYWQPALLWGFLNLYCLAGAALRHLWPAVLVSAVLSLAALLLAWRGVQDFNRQRPPEAPPAPTDTNPA